MRGMPRKRWDMQIFWVVVLGVGFWVGIFRHEDVVRIAEAAWDVTRSLFVR